MRLEPLYRLRFRYPESFRAGLVYPACDSDRSTGAHRGRLYCSWMDATDAGTTDIVLSFSDDQGAHWSSPAGVGDRLSAPADRFNHWMSVDPITGAVTVSIFQLPKGVEPDKSSIKAETTTATFTR